MVVVEVVVVVVVDPCLEAVDVVVVVPTGLYPVPGGHPKTGACPCSQKREHVIPTKVQMYRI
jgi:hypothetical protein